jgi:hypothetical protein
LLLVVAVVVGTIVPKIKAVVSEPRKPKQEKDAVENVGLAVP